MLAYSATSVLTVSRDKGIRRYVNWIDVTLDSVLINM